MQRVLTTEGSVLLLACADLVLAGALLVVVGRALSKTRGDDRE